MAREFEKKGSVSIHNIYFDTGKAELKPESEEALTKIADFLNQNPNLKLLVVGHTDSQGGLEFNMDLSARRAEAVVKALVSKYGIEQGRLKSRGQKNYHPGCNVSGRRHTDNLNVTSCWSEIKI